MLQYLPLPVTTLAPLSCYPVEASTMSLSHFGKFKHFETAETGLFTWVHHFSQTSKRGKMHCGLLKQHLGCHQFLRKVGSGNGCSLMVAPAKVHFYNSGTFKLAPRWDKFISVLGYYAEEQTSNIWQYYGLSFTFYGLGKPSWCTFFTHALVRMMATHAPVHSRTLSTFLHLAVTTMLDKYLQY